MMNFKGNINPMPFLDLCQRNIDIGNKRKSDDDPRWIPARVMGKDHADNYRERCGIDNMLNIHVLEYGRNEQIKDDRSYRNSIRYD